MNAIGDIVGGTMNEDEGKAQSRAVLDVMLGLLFSAGNTNKTLGLNVPSDWADMVDLMKKYNDLDPAVDPTTFYTNALIE